MPTKENRPAGNGAESRTAGCNHYIAGLRRRRAATDRVERLACGCRDPWTHRCTGDPTSERMADAYKDAVAHLGLLGLTAAPRVDEMRQLWRRGGAYQRLVRTVAERWEIAA